MEKKNNILIIAIIILSILVVGLGGYIIFDKVLNNGTDVEETKKVNEDVTKDDLNKKYLGSYTFTYKDNAPEDIKGNAVSSLKLNEDDTFEFIANMCSGMLTIKLPSMICMGISCILVFSLVLFEGRKMWHELLRRFHL